MTPRLRALLSVEAVTFLLAALVHAGVLVSGYEHRQAAVAESVIAVVLVAGLTVCWVRPGWTRSVGLAVQGFALLGTLVGLLTIAVGVGPRTAPDITYHVVIAMVLLWGLVVAWQLDGHSRVD